MLCSTSNHEKFYEFQCYSKDCQEYLKNHTSSAKASVMRRDAHALLVSEISSTASRIDGRTYRRNVSAMYIELKDVKSLSKDSSKLF